MSKTTSKASPSVQRVHNVVIKVFRIITKPIVITGYLLLQLAQPIVSAVIGALSRDKSIKKTSIFGATFFLRNLASEVGFNKNGGAPYTSRSKVSEGLHVGRSLTIGLTALTMYGDRLTRDPSLAPGVTPAIKTIKSRRAYGLDAKQEYSAYKSKLEHLPKELSQKKILKMLLKKL